MSATPDMPPSVFDARDYRTFLERWFAWKNSGRVRYSYRRFADDAGLGNSPSALLNVIRGKENLGADRLRAFLNALELEPEEEAFFRLLVGMDQEKDEAQRARLAAEVDEARSKQLRQRRIDDARFIPQQSRAYVERWYCPVLLDLAGRPDFVDDPLVLAPLFGGRVTPDEIEEGLAILRRLGLLTPEGRRAPTLPPILLMPGVEAGAAALGFHRDSHRLAGALLAPEAGPLLPDSEFKVSCRFLAATFLLRDADRPALYDMLSEFQQQLLARFDKADGDRGVAVCVQLFPLTEPLPSAPPRPPSP